MADPLSIASAAAGALGLTLQLYDSISAIADLYKSYKTVYEQLENLRNNLRVIGEILSRLDDTLSTADSSGEQLDFLSQPLASLRHALDEVHGALRKYDIGGHERERAVDARKSGKVLTKLSWALSGKKELEELGKKIEREKQTLVMAVSVGVLNETTALSSSVRRNADLATDEAALTRKVIRAGFEERRHHEDEISERLARIEGLLFPAAAMAKKPEMATVESRESEKPVQKEDILRLELMMQQVMLAQAQSAAIGESERARTFRILTVILIVLAIPSPLLGVAAFIGMKNGFDSLGGSLSGSLGGSLDSGGIGNGVGSNDGVLQSCVCY